MEPSKAQVSKDGVPTLFPFPAMGGQGACVALPRMVGRRTFGAQGTIQRLLPAEVASSEAERRQTQPGLKSKLSEQQRSPPTARLWGFLRKWGPTLTIQRNVPVCAHPTARLLNTAGKSLHTQLPPPLFSLPSQNQSQKHLWGGGCPSLGSAGPKCILSAWAGKALGWQTLLEHCKVTALIPAPCEF